MAADVEVVATRVPVRVGEKAVRRLVTAGVAMLFLSFLAAWTAAGSAPGAPGLGFLIATGCFAAAGIAFVMRWSDRTATLPGPLGRDSLGSASFVCFVFALGATALAFVAVGAKPSTWPPRGAVDAHLESVAGLMQLVGVLAGVAAGLAFVASYVLGRMALATGPDEEGLRGWSRHRAAIVPWIVSLALLLGKCPTEYMPGKVDDWHGSAGRRGRRAAEEGSGGSGERHRTVQSAPFSLAMRQPRGVSSPIRLIGCS